MFASVKKFFSDMLTLLREKSRTIWGVVIAGLGILLESFPQVQTLLGSIGVKPAWIAFAGLAAIVYARRDLLNRTGE